MKLAIGSDHGGFKLKEQIKNYLAKLGIQVKDLGTKDTKSVDYPVYAAKVAKAVASGKVDRGILVCGTGIGMCITANKVPGIRAALAHDIFTARMASAHNNANVLCIGGRVMDQALAFEIVKEWLDTPFEGGRHVKRLNKISKLEK